MKRKIIIAIFITLFIFGWVFAWLYLNNNKNIIKYNTWINIKSATWNNDNLEKENITKVANITLDKNQEKKDKKSALRKKLALRWLIMRYKFTKSRIYKCFNRLFTNSQRNTWW